MVSYAIFSSKYHINNKECIIFSEIKQGKNKDYEYSLKLALSNWHIYGLITSTPKNESMYVKDGYWQGRNLFCYPVHYMIYSAFFFFFFFYC